MLISVNTLRMNPLVAWKSKGQGDPVTREVFVVAIEFLSQLPGDLRCFRS